MLMALVAVAAVGMGGWRLYRLSREYRKRAAVHALYEKAFAAQAQRLEIDVAAAESLLSQFTKSRDEAADDSSRQSWESKCETWKETVASWDGRAKSSCRRSAHHASLALKYRHAAGRPWLPVAPDPTEPPPPD
jgi:hypothetical protein